MLRPSGCVPIVRTSAPRSENRRGASLYVAPCAQSTTSRSPVSDICSGTAARQNARYRCGASFMRTARPSRSGATVENGSSSSRSMSLSSSSESFSPCDEKNLMPLSSCGLWEAEITIPALAPTARVSCATAGVGIGPSSRTRAPAAISPASSADSSMYPDSRVSLPISTEPSPPARISAAPAARPRRSTKSALTGPSPTRPRMPSVPKYLRCMGGG